MEQFLYSSATVTGSTREEECEELFPVNLLGGSRFLHLTVLCFSPCMTPKALHHQVNSKDENGGYANFNFTGRGECVC